MKNTKNNGFSLIELMIAMAITLILLSVVGTLFSRALGMRTRESRKADALASARSALMGISREISNSGYGLKLNDVDNMIKINGLVLSDSGAKKIRLRANLNNDFDANDIGEDVTYFFDAATQSIVRSDPKDSPKTSVIVNKISDVTFAYFDYEGNPEPPPLTTPTNTVGRVRITVNVRLEDVQGQPSGQTVTFTSDVTLRNSKYMLKQY